LPIFIDEHHHLRLAAFLCEGKNVLLPMTEGKALQIWLSALLVPWAPDPLWASRLLTVLLGGLAVWACYETGRRLYNLRVGCLAAALYLVCPFALFYDRIAAPDGVLSTFGALVLLGTVAVVQEPRRRHGVFLGVCLGLAVATKV